MAKIRRFVTETGSFKIELLLFSFIVSIHRFPSMQKKKENDGLFQFFSIPNYKNYLLST